MSIGSEYVKAWRRRTKDRIIQSMGGKCCVCGYNKCQSALALHHIDPSQKDFNISIIRKNMRSWSVIVKELRKCILLCHNCHCELHEGIISLPDTYAIFNEDYAEYRDVKPNLCKMCGCKKTSNTKFCSSECKSRYLSKIDWDTIDLVKELENKSVLKLAGELGCSDNAIHKRLRKLGLK